jgi:hypothetical protein
MEAERDGASNGMRILVEVATAYAITKVFLPARILLSVWATPALARIFVAIARIVERSGVQRSQRRLKR